ncbi:Hypothetical protein D9617_3g022230 [Elsinoe fawcettii]|nr:Hypothetical protein D9617_3g022230 [Elsinoe fawcettii]
MEIDHRQSQSTFSLILQTILRPLKPHLVSPKKTFPAGSPKLKPHKGAARSVTIRERQDGDIFVYDFHVDKDVAFSQSSPVKRLRMYYFAGGGWQMPPSSQHWKFCAELVRKVPGLSVTLVSPPLAPKSPAAIAFPMLASWYKAALQRSARAGERVVVAGDSSGGNLALCLALHVLSDNTSVPKPHAILLVSPAVDLRPTQRDDMIQAVSQNDPVLTVESHDSEARTWVGKENPGLPWLSPVTADPSILSKAGVKLLGITGGWDILSPSTLIFRDAARESYVGGAWLHWEKQMHCFPLAFMYGIPEAVQSKDWLVTQLKIL